MYSKMLIWPITGHHCKPHHSCLGNHCHKPGANPGVHALILCLFGETGQSAYYGHRVTIYPSHTRIRLDSECYIFNARASDRATNRRTDHLMSVNHASLALHDVSWWFNSGLSNFKLAKSLPGQQLSNTCSQPGDSCRNFLRLFLEQDNWPIMARKGKNKS